MSAWRHPRLSCGAFPRENDSPAPRLRALTAFPRRERVVYPDGNRDAVAALSALLAPDVQLTAPDVQVLPADASPALEAALWAVRTPRGNRDLQRGRQKVRVKPPPINPCQRAGRTRPARDDRARLRRARRRLRRGLRAAPAARLRVRRRLRASGPRSDAGLRDPTPPTRVDAGDRLRAPSTRRPPR